MSILPANYAWLNCDFLRLTINFSHALCWLSYAHLSYASKSLSDNWHGVLLPLSVDWFLFIELQICQSSEMDQVCVSECECV